MTTTAPAEPLIWTIAFRRKTGPWFQRVELELTWAQAFYATQALGVLHPELQIYYTTTRQHDDKMLAKAATDDWFARYAEDSHNILTDSGRRVAVKDTGKLDPRLCILPQSVAKELWGRRAA